MFSVNFFSEFYFLIYTFSSLSIVCSAYFIAGFPFVSFSRFKTLTYDISILSFFSSFFALCLSEDVN